MRETLPLKPSEFAAPPGGVEVKLQRDLLAPDVRPYAENLHRQVCDVFQVQGATDAEEFITLAREGRVPRNVVERVRLLLDRLTAYVDGQPDRMVVERASHVADELKQRFREHFEGTDFDVTIHVPEIPPHLTPEHLDVLQSEILPSSVFRCIPTLADLQNLDDAYVRKMFPHRERDEYWLRPAEIRRTNQLTGREEVTVCSQGTWGGAFVRSMRAELRQIGGRFALLADHPIRCFGSDTDDPLQPLYARVFSSPDARVLDWKPFNDQLLPLVKDRMRRSFAKRKLAMVPMRVMAAPITLLNIDRWLYSSDGIAETNEEWTSTAFLNERNEGTGRRLVFGESGFHPSGVSTADQRKGALLVRLAIVFGAT